MRRKESNFIFEEVLETTGNREMELGFDISRVGEKKNENWGMFATPHTEDIISELYLTITCRFKMFVHPPHEVYFGHECGHFKLRS